MKTALGKGLEALIPEKGEDVIKIDIEKIVPDIHQPRKVFKEESLKELSQSIKERGILQPIIVSRVGDGTFRLIAGERRWRAAQIAGLKQIPALIKDVSSQDAIEIALIENIQREELNAIETANAFQRLIEEYHLTQDELSLRVGKDRATISNYLRILKLPDEIKGYINDGSISIGHAKAILTLNEKQKQLVATREIIKKGLSVREAENLCKKLSEPSAKKEKERLPEVINLENRLKQSLGTKVRIEHKGDRGKIEIQYSSLDELDRLLEILIK
jgi:ParB family chromosome partitioning protein